MTFRQSGKLSLNGQSGVKGDVHSRLVSRVLAVRHDNSPRLSLLQPSQLCDRLDRGQMVLLHLACVAAG
jgi:hypothetical protein